MSNYGVIQQGNFNSDGLDKILNLRSDVDYIEVFNETAAAVDTDTDNLDLAFQFEFQRGMTDGRGWKKTKLNSTGNPITVGQIAASGGFFLIDTSVDVLGPLNGPTGDSTLSAVSTAAIPVATNATVNGLVAGDVVRLYSTTGAPQLGGMDFTVGHNTLGNTTFSLDYMAQLTVAATAGSWRKVNFDPNFYPRHRFITKVAISGTSALVTTSVKHGYKVGQIVYFSVPTAFGMSELNTLEGTITAVNTTLASGNTFTVNINVSAFNAFVFPLAAAFPFTPAIVNVKGEDSPYAYANSLDPLADATENMGYIGVKLSGGLRDANVQTADVGPAGHYDTNLLVADKLYWRACKAFTVDNV